MLSEKLNEMNVGALNAEPVFTLSLNDRVGHVVSLLHKNNCFLAPVLSGKNYVGSVSIREIISRNLPPDSKISALNLNLPTVSSEASLAKTIRIMVHNHLREILVVDDHNFKGVFGFWQVVDWLLKQGEVKKIRVEELPVYGVLMPEAEESKKVRGILGRREVKEVLEESYPAEMLDEKEFYFKAMRFPSESIGFWQTQPEKQGSLEVEIDYMSDLIYVQISDEDSLYELLLKLKRKKSLYAKKGEFILTYRDIFSYILSLVEIDFLRVMMEEKVRILKKNSFDEDTFNQIIKHVRNFLELYSRKFNERSLKELKIEIREQNVEGRQETFEIKSLLVTDFGRFHSKKVGFNDVVEVENSIRAIENQIKFLETF